MSWHPVLTSSLKNKLILDFSCVQLIIKISEGLETLGGAVISIHNSYFFGKTFVTKSWNKLIILHGDMKCVLLIIFLAQNLIS